MILLRHCGGALPFGSYLKKIVLDDPHQKNSEDVDYYSMAVGALRLAMRDSKLDVPIERRQCRTHCACQGNWADDNMQLTQMFDPKI
jgi:hypothetical protein